MASPSQGRDAGLAEGTPKSASIRSGEELDIERLRRKARKHRWLTACVAQNDREQIVATNSSDGGTRGLNLRPLFGTTPSDLGMYGVGVQLYFEFLIMMGTTFAVMGIVSMPQLLLNILGTSIEDMLSTRYMSLSARIIAGSFLANIGSCPEGGCKGSSFNLRATPGSDTPLQDVTPWLGWLEGLTLLIYVIFGFVFIHWWIPRTVSKQDETFVTAADFAVTVTHLPRRLKANHEQYEALLTAHFMQVVADMGFNDPQAVRDVCLVREYDGSLFTLQRQGHLVVQMKNENTLARLAEQKGLQKKMDKHKAKAAKLQKQVGYIEFILSGQKQMQDNERDVCEAFVMFNKEEYKERILKKYRAAKSGWTRICLDKRLRFANKRIVVNQACEPNDLRWENLDFHPHKRMFRIWLMRLLAICLIVFLVLFLVYFRTVQDTEMTGTQRDLYILRPTHLGNRACTQLCNLRLFDDHDCRSEVQVESVRDTTGVIGTNLSTSCWDSDFCTDPQSGGWLAVHTTAPLSQALQCLKFTQDVGARPLVDTFELWACYEELVHGNGSSSFWEDACVRLVDLHVDDADSGMLHPILDTQCGFDVPKPAAEHARHVAKTDADVAIQCYCQQEASKSVYIPFVDSDGLCHEWIEHENSKMLQLVLGVFAVVGLNQAVLFIFSKVGEFARFDTASAAMKDAFFCLYLSQMVNTGIVFLLVGVNLRGSGIVLEHFESLQFGQGDHTDITNSWFVEVGVTLFTAVVCQMGSVVTIPVVNHYVSVKLRSWWFEPSCVTEDTLKELYELPEWGMSLRLAETMTIVTCVVLYSGMMPLLYWAGVAYCTMAYWVDKWSLLRTCRKPVAVSEDSIKTAMFLIPTSAALHWANTMWVFGQTEVMPSEWGVLTSWGEALLGITRETSDAFLEAYASKLTQQHDSGEDFYLFIKARILNTTRSSCTGLWMVSILIGLHMAFILIKTLLDMMHVKETMETSKLATTVGASECATSSTAFTEETFLEAERKSSGRHLLFSYRLDRNPKYKDVLHALNMQGTSSTSGGTFLQHVWSDLGHAVNVGPPIEGDIQEQIDDQIEQAYNAVSSIGHVAADRAKGALHNLGNHLNILGGSRSRHGTGELGEDAPQQQSASELEVPRSQSVEIRPAQSEEASQNGNSDVIRPVQPAEAPQTGDPIEKPIPKENAPSKMRPLRSRSEELLRGAEDPDPLVIKPDVNDALPETNMIMSDPAIALERGDSGAHDGAYCGWFFDNGCR